MENLKTAIALAVVFLVAAYNIRLFLRRRGSSDSKIYYVTLLLKEGEKPLTVRDGVSCVLTDEGFAVESVIKRLNEVSGKVSVSKFTIEENQVRILFCITVRDELLEPIKFNSNSVIKIIVKATSQKLGRSIWSGRGENISVNADEAVKIGEELDRANIGQRVSA